MSELVPEPMHVDPVAQEEGIVGAVPLEPAPPAAPPAEDIGVASVSEPQLPAAAEAPVEVEPPVVQRPPRRRHRTDIPPLTMVLRKRHRSQDDRRRRGLASQPKPCLSQ